MVGLVLERVVHFIGIIICPDDFCRIAINQFVAGRVFKIHDFGVVGERAIIDDRAIAEFLEVDREGAAAVRVRIVVDDF